MPELPEVEAIRRHFDRCVVGRSVVDVRLTNFSALKTVEPPLDSLLGLEVTAALRFGKWVGVDAQGLMMLFHLGRAGWVTWHDTVPASTPRPSPKSPLALRITLDDGSGFDLTEAGSKRRLAVHVVRDATDVEQIATLGPDPLADDFNRETLDGILDAHPRSQLKGLLRDQSVIAGIGNAYSDEIVHAAKLSPFALADSLDGATRANLFDAIRTTLAGALARTDGARLNQLKDGKRQIMRVHGRAGQSCPECGDTIREVSFSDSSLQYCPGCQTGGKPLADRRLSRLLK